MKARFIMVLILSILYTSCQGQYKFEFKYKCRIKKNYNVLIIKYKNYDTSIISIPLVKIYKTYNKHKEILNQCEFDNTGVTGIQRQNYGWILMPKEKGKIKVRYYRRKETGCQFVFRTYSNTRKIGIKYTIDLNDNESLKKGVCKFTIIHDYID